MASDTSFLQLLGRGLPAVLIVAAYAVYSREYGTWDAFSLVCLCVVCVSCARLLQSAALQWLMQRRGQQTDGSGSVLNHGYYTALALLLVLVQWVVSPEDTRRLLASHWCLLLVTPLLGVALHFGTPRAELSEALADTQTNYAQGAAWGYFLGYLAIISGQSHGTMGESEVPSFEQRMLDYLTSNEISEEKRQTYKTYKRLVILVPLKHKALLSDKNIGENDQSVKFEKILDGIKIGGRPYGETKIYTIEHDGLRHRVAMEEATPIRTAAAAVKDSAAEDFDEDDFQEFASRFLMTLKNILHNNPSIAEQVLLVPIEDIQNVGSTVVQRIRKIEDA